MLSPPLSPAARAFDAIAERFDERYGAWLSVAAQRRPIRAALLQAFPVSARVLEVGGGTGEDALWLSRQGRTVLLTDASPAMVRIASAKLKDTPSSRAEVVPAEGLETLAIDGHHRFDGAFSNFAALNCVADLAPVARGLARVLRPGAPLLVVLFGPLPPGEVVVQLARGNPRGALRRLSRGAVDARIGQQRFSVRYHRPRDVDAAFAPWFAPVERRGIGVLVPPSAAEPWISRHPALLSALERLDRIASRPLALLGDHVLYSYRRKPDAPREVGR